MLFNNTKRLSFEDEWTCLTFRIKIQVLLYIGFVIYNPWYLLKLLLEHAN